MPAYFVTVILTIFFDAISIETSFQIGKLTNRRLKEELEKYISRGNYLRNDVTYIDDSIRNAMESTRSPIFFYFVEASSGMGKSQLASSLSFPVVYIPLAQRQLIYDCFSSVHSAVQLALLYDTTENLGSIFTELRSANELIGINLQFRTVGLLVALFKEVIGKSNEESLKILSGYYGERTINYQPMTLSKAKTILEDYIKAKNKIPIFFVDEVPSGVMNDSNQVLTITDSDKADLTFRRSLFLRNVIRIMNCICILSGTEAALMNAVDNIPEPSRTEGVDLEYLRLILKLPRTNWDAIRQDSKYADLMPLLSPDVCNMLKSTRPLFVHYVLNAMLEERSMGQLTVAVLSNAKSMIVAHKKNFATSGGLYGQMALLHSKFISNTVDDLLRANEGGEKYLLAQRQSCIRHHFGNLRVLNSNDPVLSLYLDSKYIYSLTNSGRSVTKYQFKQNVAFETPHDDPLLYLICFRNGLYFAESDISSNRISCTFALLSLLNERLGRKSPFFGNTNQSSSSGKFLEMEMVSAAIIASHSYPNSLSGCPFDFFLRSMIAELNPYNDYATFDTIKDMPDVYNNVKVGLLSPANLHWRENTESVMLQDSSIALGFCRWSSNKGRNDGILPLLMGDRVSMGALEAKCYKDKVPTEELTKTINNTVHNKNLITIMAVTNFGSIRLSNQSFEKASQEVTVFKIEGNAGDDNLVATELHLKRLDSNQDNDFAVVPKHTVIVINLSSIYYNRYKRMEFAYQLN